MEPDRSKRPSEVKRLTELLVRDDNDLAICAIIGPGGIGKTYLLDYVLAAQSPADLGYLVLRVDGSNPDTQGDFFGLIADRLAARGLPAPAKPSRDYFPNTRRVAVLHRKLVDNLKKELHQSGESPEIRDAVISIARLAHVFNDTLPGRSSLPRTIFGALTNDQVTLPVVDSAMDVLRSLDALEQKSTLLPEPVREVLGITKKDRVRRDLFNLTADVLLEDLNIALAARSKPRLTQYPIGGLSRLLLVIDDYEANSAVLGDFLVSSLVPKLADAAFQVTLVICCRDDLTSTHTGWSQHVQRWLREDLRLKPFDRITASELMSAAGVPVEKHDAIFQATEGFPFLLTLAIEEATTVEGQSALFSKKFFERTTRWMTAQQKDWFKQVCYLNQVDEDTLGQLFSEEQIPAVQDWFENEASIRDPDSATFCVRPFIRHKTVEYLKVRSPSWHRTMMEKARCERPNDTDYA